MLIRIAVFKKGISKNAYQVTKYLKEKMGTWRFNKKKPQINITKTKKLLKRFCALSYKKHQEVNCNKVTDKSMKHRESFVRLFLQYGYPYDYKNVLSFDETAWYAQQ